MLVLSVLEHIRALSFVSLGMFRVLLIILLFSEVIYLLQLSWRFERSLSRI